MTMMLAMECPPCRRALLIASGFTALVSTRVFGANGTLRVGVIGAGGRMGDLINAAENVAAAECLPLWDLSKSSRGMVLG
ncbi:MAG: hypothetical protein WCE61_23700 [Candidatus Acidiferrum sp.]